MCHATYEKHSLLFFLLFSRVARKNWLKSVLFMVKLHQTVVAVPADSMFQTILCWFYWFVLIRWISADGSRTVRRIHGYKIALMFLWLR